MQNYLPLALIRRLCLFSCSEAFTVVIPLCMPLCTIYGELHSMGRTRMVSYMRQIKHRWRSLITLSNKTKRNKPRAAQRQHFKLLILHDNDLDSSNKNIRTVWPTEIIHPQTHWGEKWIVKYQTGLALDFTQSQFKECLDWSVVEPFQQNKEHVAITEMSE